jgi:stage V sporulation protein B
MSLRNYKSVNYRISKSIQFTFILGVIFTAIFLAYPDKIGGILYRKENVGGILYLLSFTCIFTYLQQTLLGILNGLGKQAVSLKNSVIGSVIRIGFVYFCIPVYGIKGYVWGIIISSACVCVLNLSTVVKTTGMVIDIKNWIIKPGLVGIFMFFASKYIYSFFTIFNTGVVWNTLLSITANVIMAIIIMTFIGVLKRGEVGRLIGLKKRKNI